MDAMTLENLFRSAVGRHQAGQLKEAEGMYRQVLSMNPQHAGALHLLGCIAIQSGYMPDAIMLIKQSLANNPRDFGAWHNLGEAFRKSNQLVDAANCYQEALALKGDFIQSHEQLGRVMFKMGRYEEAAIHGLRAAELMPGNANLWFDVGAANQMLGRYSQAQTAYRRALEVQPRHALSWNNLGLVYRETGNLDQADECFSHAVEIDGKYADALSNLGLIRTDFGEIESGLGLIKQCIEAAPGHGNAWSNYLYMMQFSPGITAKNVLESHRQWNERLAAGLKRRIEFKNDRNPQRRLRVGFVSADFREHTVMRNVLPLLREFDRKEIETFCYSDVMREDGFTRMCRESADVWIASQLMNDEELASRVTADGIDILVDLSCHSAFNRMLMFARKPAPVQVSWLGYPGTTGLEAMDYRLSDQWIDPEGKHDGDYVEKTILLKSYWCCDPLGDAVEVSESPAMKNGFVTFGCLSQSKKTNDEVARTWAQVLKAVEGSRMILLGRCQRVQDRIRKAMGAMGERVEFVGQSDRETYLRQYHRIDVVLDTFPYNGPSTGMDALWMGAAVVALNGELGVGRGCGSILNAVGLGELAGTTREEYISIATCLGRDPARLGVLRRELRQRMEKSVMMDIPGFARDMEKVFRSMWRRWIEGERS